MYLPSMLSSHSKWVSDLIKLGKYSRVKWRSIKAQTPCNNVFEMRSKLKMQLMCESVNSHA